MFNCEQTMMEDGSIRGEWGGVEVGDVIPLLNCLLCLRNITLLVRGVGKSIQIQLGTCIYISLNRSVNGRENAITQCPHKS